MADRMRLHIEWVTSKAPHMAMNRDVWDAVAARHPEMAGKLDVTFGRDMGTFEQDARDAQFLITQKIPPFDLDRAAPALEWVHTTSAGVESFWPLDWLPERAVLTNNSGTHIPKMREYATMALLMLHIRMPAFATSQREKVWKQAFGPTIKGATVAIVGFGALGTACAEAARSLGVSVRAVRRNPAPHELADAVFPPDRLGEALDGADFLIVAAPLTEETRGLVDGAALDRLAPGAGVVNVGRAPIIDTKALVERLDSERLSGAIVDVFEKEPMPAGSPLWHQKNLIVTPHMCSDDPSTYIPRSLDIFMDNLQRRLKGEPMTNVVDPVLGY